eukprot:scaffold1600_cov179-Amphora_coffeaeformis.AAC.14
MKLLQPFPSPSVWFSCRSCSKTESQYVEDESCTSETWDDFSVSTRAVQVHFCLAQNEYYESAQYTGGADYSMELWYSERDFDKFREDAIACATQSCAQEMISQAYAKCQRVSTKQDWEDLWSWQSRAGSSSLPASSVGLEKWIIPDNRRYRSLQRRKQYARVQRIQTSSLTSPTMMMMTMMICSNEQPSTPNDKAEHEMRHACVRVSQAGRLFALYLGRMVHEQREHDDCSD